MLRFPYFRCTLPTLLGRNIMIKTPTKLTKEPLVDAVFELRFSSVIPASSVLPGVYFSSLKGEKKIERLPVADLPSQLRDADPNLRFAPVTRISWDRFLVLISDHSVGVACQLPYAGWGSFKPAILEVVDILKKSGVAQTVNRYAVKYVDLIPSKDLAEQVSFANLSLTLGTHKLSKEVFQLRVEIPRDDGFTHSVQIAASASVRLLNGELKEGMIIDVDTSRIVENEELQLFLERLPDHLEAIHARNKEMFFECITPETIESLGPKYE